MPRPPVSFCLVTAGLLFLGACTKLTHENYEKIGIGMDKNEVESIIGFADHCAEEAGVNICVWGEEQGTHVTVRFVGNRTVKISQKGLL